jgi:hypothetical protein
VKSAIQNFGLLLLSLAVTWVVIELVIFPIAVPHLPMRLHPYLGALEPLAQSSKSGLKPKGEWMLLVGDSYAKGNGDWFLSVDKGGNPPFQAAHVIHEKTGRDVLNFGLPGAGSAGGWVMRPEEFMTWLDLSWRYGVERPKTVFAYFYEGNDLDDNLRRAAYHFGGVIPDGFLTDAAAIDAYLETFAGARQRNKMTIFYNLFALKFARNILRHEFSRRRAAVSTEADLQAATQDRPTASPPSSQPSNAVRIGDRTEPVSGPLQSPSLELSPAETAGALLISERALVRLRAFFPDADIVTVYLPSPLTAYEPASDQVVIQTYHKGPARWPAAAVAARSDVLCRHLRDIAVRTGVGFLDTRVALRAAARVQAIHGPRDWKHLNRHGQEVLAGVLSDSAGNGASLGACAALSR